MVKKRTSGSVKKAKPPQSQYSDLFKFSMSEAANKPPAKPMPLTKSSMLRAPGGPPTEELDIDPEEALISDKRLEKQEREAWKHSFFLKYIKDHENEDKERA